MYGNYVFRMKDSAEISYTFDSEVCYEVRDCNNCHTVFFAADSFDCSDCSFIENCRNCHHCVLCSDLVNKDYYRENTPLSKEEFLEKEKELKANRGKYIDAYKQKFKEISLQTPKKNLSVYQSENCVGDHIYDSKDCKESFMVRDAETCRHCDDTIINVKDTYDWLAFGVGAQLCYEGMTASMNIFHCAFCFVIREDCRDLYYCADMSGCSNCFGCTGLRNKEFCILNKQYTQAEYTKLVPQIIDYMRTTGERGEFFPASISPFAYNETVALRHMPLSKDEALKK